MWARRVVLLAWGHVKLLPRMTHASRWGWSKHLVPEQSDTCVIIFFFLRKQKIIATKTTNRLDCLYLQTETVCVDQ
ncbi:hypothetical protein ACFX13_007942 [Malus domestica]